LDQVVLNGSNETAALEGVAVVLSTISNVYISDIDKAVASMRQRRQLPPLMWCARRLLYIGTENVTVLRVLYLYLPSKSTCF